MAKLTRRKPPKRKQSERPKLDDDLTELAQILDEHRLENNAEGWFSLPWRNGWNAIGLALELLELRASWDLTHSAGYLTSRGILSQRVVDAEAYWRCGELLVIARPEGMLYAAIRGIQVLGSNSSGGGEVYNYLLKNALDTDLEFDDRLGSIVLKHRCKDAIGVYPDLDNGPMDRARRAFQIAWNRGLYHAAYSIAPERKQ